MKNSKNILIMFACFFVLLIINSIFIFRNPWFDWDIVSYIWNVKYIENKNIEEVHTQTYEELKNYLDPWRYKIILSANQYRKEVYKDYESFLDIMPFYNIKFIYIYSIYWVHKLWLSIIDSIIAISIFSYLIFCSLLFFIFRKELEKYPILFFALYLLTFSSPILIAWRSTTPDMFWALFLMIWTFLILRKQVIIWIIILIISLGARTDNIIFIWVLLFYLRFFSDKSVRINTATFIIWSIVALWFYKWINTYFDNFWYIKLYYNSFIEPIPYPSTFVAHLVPMDFLIILKDKVAILLGLRENRPVSFFPFYIILSIIAFLLAQKNKIKLDNIYLWLMILSVFTLVFKFAIFPNIQERYFVFYFIIILITLTKFMINIEEKELKKLH
jgi:hypothetical protein